MPHILFRIDQPTQPLAPQYLISYEMTGTPLLATGTTKKHENIPVRNALKLIMSPNDMIIATGICGLIAKNKSRRVIAPIKLTLRRVPLTDKSISITAGIVMHLISQ